METRGNQEYMKDNNTYLPQTKVYAGRIKDTTTLIQSSSGGAFTAISDSFLENGDAIVCALYNYETHAMEFKLITDKSDRDAARGSKYVQSKPETVFRQANHWLKENPEKNLLFVGMGCQADGFRKYIETVGIRDRVWIADIICHGSPSPKLWREYADRLEKKYRGSMSELSFKDKRNGWRAPTAKAVINGREVFLSDYVKIFYNRCALRPSCHECPFATIERKTDMTIGDFWHIEEKMPDFYDPNGNSLFLIHTDKGMQLFESIKVSVEYRESNTIDCWQANLEKPTLVSDMRKQFWEDYQSNGIKYIMKKYAEDSFGIVAKRFLRKIKRKLIR